jgi:3-oxoadipate enol-lactonase
VYLNQAMLHIEDRGTGAALVLLHGSPTTPRHLRPLAERLSARWRTLLVHLPGYGESASLVPYDLDRSHELVEEAVAARGVDRAHLIGHSGGANRALAIAARAKVAVTSVVSLSAIARFPEEVAGGYIDLAGRLRGGADLTPMMAELMLSPAGRMHPDWVAEVQSWAQASRGEDLAREFEAFAHSPDLLGAIARLEMPILLRVGARDQATPLVRSEEILGAAKHATLQVVPDVGHAILCEDFEGTAEAIARHLEVAESAG